MIDYIRYSIDGKTYDLIRNDDNTWSKEILAPNVIGRYDLSFEISEDGIVTYIDNSSEYYDLYLKVIVSADKIVRLQELVPDYIASIREFNIIYDVENLELDKLYASIEQIKANVNISTSTNDTITRIEKYIGIRPHGTLEQRKNYIKSLYSRGTKLNEQTIKSITQTIAGADCIINFFSENELSNPEPGHALLRVQVLSPDGRDYRYEDIERTLKTLIPAHLKLTVIKYFSIWGDITSNFSDWNSVKALDRWGTVNKYIPPL